jgi:hypothetical protein
MAVHTFGLVDRTFGLQVRLRAVLRHVCITVLVRALTLALAHLPAGLLQ